MKNKAELEEVMTPMRDHALQAKKITLSGGNAHGPALKQSERTRVQTVNKEPTLTQQQFKDEADINNIMRKYGADPVAFNALTRSGGVYADFSEIKDYHSILQDVQNAQDAFASLPAQLRSRFENDPGKLITFLQNSENQDEAEKLGLVNPKSKTETLQKTNKQNPGAPVTSKNDLNDKTETKGT